MLHELLSFMRQHTSPATCYKSTAYAMLVSSIEPYWPMPPTLKRKLQEAQLKEGAEETKIACSIAMSFYHTSSKRFYGSTWVGYEHVLPVSNFQNLQFPVRNLNELMYFQSSVDNDPNRLAVIELVTTTFDSFTGSVASRYGCGWALISPFHIVEKNKEETRFTRITVFEGTPRELLSLKGDGAAILRQLNMKKIEGEPSVISYRIWRLETMSKLFKTSGIVSTAKIFEVSIRIMETPLTYCSILL